MSGGCFDYVDMSLQSSIFGFEAEKYWNALEDLEISELTWDLLSLLHYYDWYSSGDTSEEAYLIEKNKFKDKWLRSSEEDRLKRSIDDSLENVKADLYKTFLK